MLGATGAFACFAAGTGLGLWLRSRCQQHLQTLEAWADALQAMGLLLEEERLPLGDLLWQSAQGLESQGTSGQVRARLSHAAKQLEEKPSRTLSQAYLEACKAYPLQCEQAEEQGHLALLFRQMGSGTSAMRSQAVTACGRRLALLIEKARQKAEQTGKLYAQLGVLGGLMLAIALW